ncbi:glucose 1-dehydrogenase [Saccharopolyspora gloriosae]|uniref:NAD(P)-dependent dehydrogenase (Short-subunit alcohol dehydrogenase family) n=1 Tax=Saccharopolyspora gloriosae TaxID=455344 RepID=A0A840NLZ0_9PSEU|nr:NAD(P)-dependent dehydrogenase (short-subunit alcohol dehydrogenase family) [Saccharopolyspora gloriosae]
MTRRLDGSTALVTGATGGLGVPIVRRLAAEGARVIITDVDVSACERLAAELGTEATVHALDVAEQERWHEVTVAVEAEHGGLDVLVNNAGIGSLATVEDETVERWERVIDIDQRGTWLGMKHCGPLIERSGGGSIVNIASILGTGGGLANSFGYAAAKGAVRSMTANAALHWAERGVRVNAVVPGFIGTAQLHERFDGGERHRAMLANTPMGRLGRPEEVAAAVAHLASDDAGYTTGSELYVDGGWAAR